MKVTLYAEGSRETGNPVLLPAPGNPLPEASLGAAHDLFTRCIADATNQTHVTFLSPLRDTRGRRVQGSQLLHRATLRRLLSWPNADLRPDLAIVLVDFDGDNTRLQQLRSHVEGIAFPPVVVAVAIQEFESWLIGDHGALQTVLGSTFDQPKDPESMGPGEAKELLSNQLARANTTDVEQARRHLAQRCDLERLRQRCPSLGTFMRDLRAALQRAV